MFPSRTITLAINRSCQDVYDFLASPANLSRWTGGVLHSPLEQVDDLVWLTTYEGNRVLLHFTAANPHGVIDLRVTSRGAPERVYRARVFPNGEGTELCCTVFQGAAESDAQFQSEVEWLRTDLHVLRAFIEAM